jgi:glycosyltransferase involved in cell wall biosynthesis
MKISLVDPSLFTWPYDVKLADGLIEIGHSVSIVGSYTKTEVVPGQDSLLQRHFYPAMQSKALSRLPSQVQLALKGLSHVESMARLIRRFKNCAPDVIHFQWTPLPIIDARLVASFRAIAPSILTVHDSNPFNNNPRSKLQRIAAGSIFKHFDHLIVHTAQARDRLVKRGAPEDTISKIPIGLLIEHVELPAEVDPVERQIGILLFGQIKPYKGVDVLLQAIALLPPQTLAKCSVRIVGRPEMPMGPLFSMVADLGLQTKVEFDLRFVPEAEIAQIIARADIVVFPYREIDASGVLMLALAAGRPIVASNLGVFSEWLGPQAAAVLVQPDNPEELATALVPLISDRRIRQSHAERVLKLRNSVPSWKSIARLTELAYERAIRDRKPSAAESPTRTLRGVKRSRA